jgi:predicted nucleotidyltransferase
MNQLLLQNEIEILMCFFPRLDDLASKEIEKKSGYSHESTFRILKGLVHKKYLIEKKVGKTNVYEIVKDRDVIYQVFTNYMTKKRLDFKQKHLLIYKRLYEFLNEINTEGPAIIFGSFAKGTETKKSDIDILLVNNKKGVQNTVQVFKTKYNMNIQPAIVKTADFKNIKKDNPQFWNDLIEYGIVLDGLDLFFKEVYLND